MINHARTLLLAEAGTSRYPIDYPGEEYVELSFVPPALDATTDLLRRRLVGEGDRAFRNLRLRQILQLVHAGRLGSELTRYDSRLTYYPFARDDFYTRRLNGPRVTQTAGTAASAQVDGYRRLRHAFRLYHRYRVEVLGGDEVQIDYTDDDGIPRRYTESFPAGAAARVDLPNLGGAGVLFANTVGAVFEIEMVLTPEQSLGSRLEHVLTTLSERETAHLFERGKSALLDDCRQFFAGVDRLDQLAAVTVALLERLETARQG